MQSTVTSKLSLESIDNFIGNFCTLLIKTMSLFNGIILQCNTFSSILFLLAGIFILIAGLKYRSQVAGGMVFLYGVFYGFVLAKWLTSSIKLDPGLFLFIGLIFAATITVLYFRWRTFTVILKYFVFESYVYFGFLCILCMLHVPYAGILALIPTVAIFIMCDIIKFVNIIPSYCGDFAICAFGCSLLTPIFISLGSKSLLLMMPFVLMIALVGSFFGQKYYWDIPFVTKE